MQTAVQESNMNPNSSRVIIVTINRLPPGYKIPSTYHTSIVVVFPFFLPDVHSAHSVSLLIIYKYSPYRDRYK